MSDNDNKIVEDKKPTEEQVKTANELEKAKWEGDYSEEDLKVPYKREEDDGDKSKDSKTDDGSATKGDAKAGDDAEKPTEAPAVEYTEPTPILTVEDPGEFKPGDYSFKVVLKDGKKTTVKTPQDAEDIAEDPENFETPAQLMDFINKQNKMNRNLERDEEKYQAQKEQFESQSAQESQRMEIVDNIAKEIQYLLDKGELPQITDPEVRRRWETDPKASLDKEFIKNPGVAEQIQLVNKIAEEREARVKAGLSPNVSAIDMWREIKSEVEAKSKENKAAGESRKAAGSRVAGTSPAAQAPYVPKGIAVGNPNVFKRDQAVWDD